MGWLAVSAFLSLLEDVEAQKPWKKGFRKKHKMPHVLNVTGGITKRKLKWREIVVSTNYNFKKTYFVNLQNYMAHGLDLWVLGRDQGAVGQAAL